MVTRPEVPGQAGPAERDQPSDPRQAGPVRPGRSGRTDATRAPEQRAASGGLGGLGASDEGVGGGDQQESDQGRADQPADHRTCQGRLGVGALPDPEGQGEERQDRGERRHQDRSEAATTGLGHGFAHGGSVLDQAPGLIDEEDGVVHHNPAQDDAANGALDVESRTGQVQRHQDADGREGDREHDHQGVPQGLVLASEHHVDQRDGQQEREHELACRLLLFFKRARHLDGVPPGPGQRGELGLQVSGY